MTRTVQMVVSCIAVVLVTFPATAQTTFNFDSAGGWTTGQMDGLVSNPLGWNAGGQWFVDSSGAGNASTAAVNEIAVYSQPIVLTNPSDSFGFTMNFEYGGGPYATPTDFTYLMKAGLTDSSDPADATGGAGGTAADANLQIASSPAMPSDTYRLLDNFMTVAGATNIDSTQINTGDQFRYDYNITLGTDAASTSYTVQLQNLTDATDTGVGTVTGVDQSIYDALTGTGAYAFFQNLDPSANGTGLNRFQVNSIGALPDPPPAPVFRTFDYAGPSFSDGGLNGQQGWNAEASWNVADAAGAGNANTPDNSEIAVYSEPITLQVGETFSYEMEFEFSGTYATPNDFVYTFASGLKPDATADGAVPLGNQEAADANIQVVSAASGDPPDSNDDKYRLLSNFKTIAGASNLGGTDPLGNGDGTQLNEGDLLKFEYEITLGADAASTTYRVLLQNLTDGTTTGIGEVDNHTAFGDVAPGEEGIHPDLYAALTGTGAFVFFQSVGLSDAGFDGLTVHSITGDLPEFTGVAVDVDGDGDIDGADFLQLQRNNPGAIADWIAAYPSPLGGLEAIGAVPEPSTLLLMSFASCALLPRRIKR